MQKKKLMTIFPNNNNNTSCGPGQSMSMTHGLQLSLAPVLIHSADQEPTS